MAFLRGLGGAPVALATAVDEKTVSQWLARQVIDPQLPLAEVKVFTETRVPNMPRVRNAAEWRTIAAKTRRDVLDKVVFTGGAAQWRNTPLKVEWLDTIEDLPGYRIKKLRFECLPGWWIPALLYEPAKLANKVPVVLNVNGHSRAGMVTPYKQERCINLAKRGMLSMNVEWIGMGQFANRLQEQPRQLSPFAHPGHFGKGPEIGIVGSLQLCPVQENRFPEDKPAILRLTRGVVTFQAGQFTYLGPYLIHEITIRRRFRLVRPQQGTLQAKSQQHHVHWPHQLYLISPCPMSKVESVVEAHEFREKESINRSL